MEWQSLTSAVDAVIIIMMGDSTINAKENATPYAARLNLGSGRRAMIAAIKGPSVAIISHVAASGAQNFAILPVVSDFLKFFSITIQYRISESMRKGKGREMRVFLNKYYSFSLTDVTQMVPDQGEVWTIAPSAMTTFPINFLNFAFRGPVTV